MIGIAMTTRNRNETARHTLNQILKYSPTVCKVVVVDDASDVPFEGATHRFDERVGVATAKNKCLELLDTCEHIFLFDDDCAPVVDNWWLGYTTSHLNHANYTFNATCIGQYGTYWEFEKPNGCMIYIKRVVLSQVGGWDDSFKGYGFDHPSWSDRIFNSGLTPARYIDIPNSQCLFEMAQVPSSFDLAERYETIPINEKLYHEKFNSKEFKPYK